MSGSTNDVPGAIPLTLPAILQRSRPRFSNLIHPSLPRSSKARSASGSIRDPSAAVGKRRIRRWENAQLSSNPHIVRPSSKDLLPSPPSFKPLFVPRPSSFSPSIVLPETSPSAPTSTLSSDLDSLTKGMFSLSLRGVKRGISKSLKSDLELQGPLAKFIIAAEAELKSWLESTVGDDFHSSGLASGGYGGKVLLRLPKEEKDEEEAEIIELSRAPEGVRWIVPDGYHRFLLHCLARYYGLNSFSAPAPPSPSSSSTSSNRRITHISRPQFTKPRLPTIGAGRGGGGGWGLDTPPGTDLSASEMEMSSAWEKSSVGEDDVSEDSDWEEVERPLPPPPSLSPPVEVESESDSEIAVVATSTPRPAFIPFVPSSSPSTPSTPTPTTSRTPSQTPSPTPTQRPTRASFPPSSGLRRSHSDASEESPSRSPIRAPIAKGRVSGGGGRKGRELVQQVMWDKDSQVPEKSFLRFLLE